MPKTKIQIPEIIQKHPAYQYAEDVRTGKILACNYLKLTVKRFFNDLENAGNKGWYIDLAKVEANIQFFEKLLKHTKGPKAGEPFDLEPFQKFIIFNVYGWYNEDGTRRFQKAYIKIARKNGKTALAAGLELIGASIDGEEGAEVYSAATKEDQAKIVWSQARDFIKKSNVLQGSGFSSVHGEIRYEPSLSIIKYLGRDSKTQDGLNPSKAIIDEYHAHPTNDVIDVIQSGMGARKNPLTIIITTAGKTDFGPCKQYEDMVKEVLRGKKIDETLFAIIFELDNEAEFDNPEMWIKANPGIGTILSFKYLENQYHEVLNLPSKKANFLTKHCNIWVSSYHDEWFDVDKMRKAMQKNIPIEKFQTECIAGFDLASVSDLTAVTSLTYPDENGIHYAKVQFFMPADNIPTRVKKDRVDYDLWQQQGFITATPGASTDYNYVMDYVQANVNDGILYKSMEFDPWNSNQIMNQFDEKGFEVHSLSQGIGTISEPTKQLEKLFLSEKIIVEYNPVLEWMFGNIVMYEDANGNKKIHKGKSLEKIDGWVSMVNAIAGFMIKTYSDNNESRYNDPDEDFIFI